jgi:hypothetical protein
MSNIFHSIQKFTCHPITRRVVYMIAALSAIVCVIVLLTSIPRNDADLKNKLKDLEEQSKQLEQKQSSYDSVISGQKELIANLDYAIHNVKEKTTLIREYYIKEQEKVDTFTHNQIDSFFKSRYKY